MRDYDHSIAATEQMEDGTEKAIQWAVYGLSIEGGHHKQWFLEQVLLALGVDPNEPFEALTDDGYEPWTPGIAP